MLTTARLAIGARLCVVYRRVGRLLSRRGTPIRYQGLCMDQDVPGAPDDSPEPVLEQTTGSTSRLAWNPFLGVYLAQAPARMRRRELTSECLFCADLTSGRVAPGTQAWIRPNDFPPLLPPQ